MWKPFCLILVFNLLSFDVYSSEQTDYAADLKKATQALNEQDYTTAYKEYYRVAEKVQNPLAQFNLALFYHFGWERPKDEIAACHWYAKAASGNIPAAQHFYADCLREGVAGTKAPTQAAIWYRRAADNGHIISLCSLAELYIAGTGVSKDTQQGLALCQQAANAGLRKAMLRMASFYLSDDPILRNSKNALYYLQQAAELRNVKALFMFGELHRDGIEGLSIDHQIARQWFELAAALGYIPAYYQVGVLYFNGDKALTTNALPAEYLAKAYLWLSAATQRSKNKNELLETKLLLNKISAFIPKTWTDDLDEKLNEHLRRYPVIAKSMLVNTQ